jgi:bifunctional non-homologous end joining protein LigD
MLCPDIRTLRPMLATLADAPLQDRHLVYEPKYDGIRGLVEIVPRGRTAGVRLFSRLGNEKSAQFPELIEALSRFGSKFAAPVIVDGEVVALDAQGQPAGFQRLQGRIHLTHISEAETVTQPVALMVFDLLCENGQSLCERPLTERRARLEQLFATPKRGREPFLVSPIRLSEIVKGDGRALYDQALTRGWEGLIVKHADSLYRPGRRTTDWRKVKLVRRQEFVVVGWTEPRSSRSHFGALLLGYYSDGVLKYAGHTGSGFDEKELTRVSELLRPLEMDHSPFKPVPKTNERPHWVKPSLVAEVRFTEWTDEGLLRHPIYLGLRTDVKAESVRREPTSTLTVMTSRATGPVPASSKSKSTVPRSSARPESAGKMTPAALQRLHDELQRMESERGEGIITLPDNVKMSVTNLKKLFWPKLKITKGELLRYYVKVAPYLLPVVEDRPLVMKRFPNGVGGKDFYQHRAPDTVPEGVRVEAVEGDTEVPARFIGGSLLTLLHMAQLAAISQDPYFSRVQSIHMADHTAIDLDPGDGVPFARILDTARWVQDELEKLGVRGFPKTSGADGLHIYIPLEPNTPYEAGMLFCQIVATIVAQKHPNVATIERKVRARGQTVYVDYLQNIEGKTLACAYSARASEYAGASTPLTWKEIDEGVDPRDFTIRSLPDRLERVGDLWAGLRKAKGTNLMVVEKYGRT